MILVNHNGRDRLANCLQALQPQAAEAGADVVVVDNASTDSSLEYLRSQRGRLRLITSTSNLGFAAANNLAIRESRSPYAVLLNTDTRPQPGALAALLYTPLDGRDARAVLLGPFGWREPGDEPEVEWTPAPRPEASPVQMTS